MIKILTDTGAVIDRIGVEGSAGLGLLVVAALRASGHDVREVQASRTNDRRRRRHRAKTDITDAQAIAAETLADPTLPPARKHAATPSQAWDTLRVLRAQRESLVLQRVRLLTEAEPVLCAPPIEIRDQLPSTSQVMAALKEIHLLELDDASRADTAQGTAAVPKTSRRARRPHKRQLANVITRRIWPDADHHQNPVELAAA